MRKKVARKIYMSLTILYFIAVAWATVYSQTSHLKSLPKVQLSSSDNGIIPIEALDYVDGLYDLISVEQADGPWGNKYLIKRIRVLCYPEEGGYRKIYGFETRRVPFVIRSDVEYLADGMEVLLE